MTVLSCKRVSKIRPTVKIEMLPTINSDEENCKNRAPVNPQHLVYLIIFKLKSFQTLVSLNEAPSALGLICGSLVTQKLVCRKCYRPSLWSSQSRLTEVWRPSSAFCYAQQNAGRDTNISLVASFNICDR